MWAKLTRSSEGNVTTIFAFMSTVILIGAGAALDFNNLVTDKMKTQHALDTAVLAAAQHYQENQDQQDASAEGKTVFNHNCFASSCTADTSPNFTITGTGKVTANIHMKAPSIFGSVVERTALNYAVKAEAQLAAPAFHHNIYFVLDSSASLGIAATQAERDTLKALTAPYVAPWMAGAVGGCAFACHFNESFIQPEIDGTVVTTYDFARDQGITLREDVLIDQVSATIDEIYNNSQNGVRVGIYAFSDTLELVEAPSRNIVSVKDSLDGSGLARWGTRTDQILPQLNSTLGNSGTGTSQADAVKSVILVTDGLNNNYSGGILTDAFDAADCNGLKANGINIAVLHLTYPDLTGQSWYDFFVSPHYDEIPTALQSCANDGMYFTADTGSDMATALNGIADVFGVGGEKQLALTK